MLGNITVKGEGSRLATLAVVGQSPSEEEERAGRPLVGPAGRLLQECFAEVGLTWTQTYRTNVFKRRLLQGVVPTAVRELITLEWRPPLMLELRRLTKVRLILTLGNEALFALSGQWGITHYRGRIVSSYVGGRRVPVLPTIHPAYVLRTDDKVLARNWLLTDLERVRDFLSGRV